MTWEPVANLTLRGSYSRAFRAPALFELASTGDAFIEFANDPAHAGAVLPVLFLQGENPDLEPERAKTWTLGTDYQPSFAPWLQLSFSYFNIHYNGRIEQPSVDADRELVLERASRFPGLITLMPTADQAQSFIDLDSEGFIDNATGIPFDPATQNILVVFPNLALFDNRKTNLAVEKVRGIDLIADAKFDTQIGELNFGLNLTHTLNHDRRVTPESPPFTLLNEVGKPVDTRFRAKLGWSKGAWSVFGFVNYVDDYKNPFSDPPSHMGSWATVDLTVRFLGSKAAQGGLLNGLDAGFSVRNLFDNAPPRFPSSLQGVLYDSTNANAFGRHFSLRLTKHW